MALQGPKSGSLVLDIKRVWTYLRVSTDKQKKFDKEDNSIELQVCISVFYVYMYGFYYLTCFSPAEVGLRRTCQDFRLESFAVL